MEKLLANQVTLVTGASSGIGYGIDIVLANRRTANSPT
ncbi:NAD(P)-dependent dehydrogenase (short-subunit alcohol dehydrogenase family) [Paraburkholderia sp. CI2]|nr:NAD(P)-dependent dehydrogenase (short-subunit alcohol dehydrogenase family) [Paraburkholderia sp. CI2]